MQQLIDKIIEQNKILAQHMVDAGMIQGFAIHQDSREGFVIHTHLIPLKREVKNISTETT